VMFSAASEIGVFCCTYLHPFKETIESKTVRRKPTFFLSEEFLFWDPFVAYGNRHKNYIGLDSRYTPQQACLRCHESTVAASFSFNEQFHGNFFCQVSFHLGSHGIVDATAPTADEKSTQRPNHGAYERDPLEDIGSGDRRQS
jgi:hypothetical protein